MILLVDIGNTRVKWCLADADGLSTHSALPVASIGRELLNAWALMARPERVVIASVLGEEVTESIRAITADLWAIQPSFLHAQAVLCGVTNGYADPRQLGVDRWMALIGARAVSQGAVCVVNCGTALTLDWLAADGKHVGGLIAPGLRLGMECLMRNTHGVRVRPELEAPEIPLLGRDTSGCTLAGVIYSAVSLVEHTRAAVGQGREVTCVVSGGDGQLVGSRLSAPTIQVPDLVFRGLHRVAFTAGDDGVFP